MCPTPRKHLKTGFELEKLLWRYRKGWYDDSRVSDELSQKADQLAGRSFQLNEKIDILRRFRQEELIQLDNLRGEIVRHIGRREFENAVEKIRLADKILNEFEETVIAAQRYDSVREAIDRLKTLTGDTLFVDTLTFKIVLQLQQKTREYLETKESPKAMLNLLVCQGEMTHLLDRQKDISKSGKLGNRVKKIRETLERVHQVKSPGINNRIYYSKIDRLQQLIKSDYLLLAERLLEEFEIEISNQFLFFSEYQKAAKGLKKSIMKRNKISNPGETGKQVNDWDDAARYLLEKRLKTYLSHSKKVGEKIAQWFETNKEE